MWHITMDTICLLIARQVFIWIDLDYKWIESPKTSLGKMDQKECYSVVEALTKWESRGLVWAVPTQQHLRDCVCAIAWALPIKILLASESKTINCQNPLVLIPEPSNLTRQPSGLVLACQVCLSTGRNVLALPNLIGTGIMVLGVN